MNNGLYLASAVLLFVGFLLYFRVARTYNIVDVPNHRTMHEGATIRGGGIVIFIAMALYALLVGNPGIYFVTGLTIMGITGFLDDLYNLPGKVRFPLQMLSIILLLAELQLLNINIIWLTIILILATGTLNAFNFMDGINGMTGGYATVTVISMIIVNNFVQNFISDDFLYFILLALIVFNLFNFRKRAVCFAGDVGSLTIALILIFILIKMVYETHQIVYILFLTLYGIDTIFTIVQRLYLRQNIFEAHRLHLFQVVISKTGMPHLRMSTIYMVLQLAINTIVIQMAAIPAQQQVFYAFIMLLGLSLSYIIIKKKITRIAV